jgi:hypothetical protein
MSRYGIEVVGAVGSTERLESLTNNVAKLFGGQAKAQADTMTGALEQMKNALGDVGEQIGSSLAPMITSLAKGLTSLATETGAEQKQVRILFNVLKDVNASEEVRATAIESVNEQYGKYIPHLLTENSTLAEIKKAQDAVTGAMLKRIALSINEEAISDIMREQLELRGQETLLIDALALATKNKDKIVSNGEGEHLVGLWAQREAQKDLNKNREEQKEIQTGINKLNEDAVSLAESFSQTDTFIHAGKPLINLFDEDDIAILPDVMVDMQELDDMFDEAFGTEDDPMDKSIGRKIDGARELASALNTAFDPDMTGSEKMKSMGIQMLTLLEGVVISAGAVNTSLSAMFSGPLGWGAIIGSLALLEGAKAGVRALEFADGGIVQGQGTGDTVPAMLTPGEVILNQAQQSNLVGGMGGVTINVSAPLVDETILDTIIPAIEKAHRMNLA